MFRVLIPKWESCESNGKEFVIYWIQVYDTTDGKCDTIRKRYRDFHRLNKKIKKLINISSVFPPKKVRNNMNHKFVEQRREALEKYLQNILRMDSIPKEVLEFLNVSNDCYLRLEREPIVPHLHESNQMNTNHMNTNSINYSNRISSNEMESNGIRYESNSYPMIAFKHDINNICCSTISQRSSSSSLNDIIINGVIDGFYYM
jgi:hypothetical protein